MALRREAWAGLATADRVALGFAGVVIMVAAASTDNPAEGMAARGLDGWAALLLAAAALLLAGARRFPGTVALAVLGISFVWYGVGYTSGLVNVATLIAFSCLGASEGEGQTFGVAGISVVALLVNVVVVQGESVQSGLTAAGYVLVAVLFGELVRTQRLVVDHLADRAERAEAEAERRVMNERLRIARDIHDVLAHTVSVVTVQAEVAADALDRDRDTASAAVDTIRRAGREVMDQVRATVAVLRSGSDPAGTMPVPRIAEIDDLLDAAREQGLDITVDVAVSEQALPEMVELTTFRIVQEGITNVLRHAQATSAQVTIREDGSELVVEVRDDGPPQSGRVTAGFGLAGMAERVESVGGELWHGRDTDGGWVVRASLPLPVAVR
jgi:signal transduction histidine kinase